MPKIEVGGESGYGCASPDCEYMALEEGGTCFAHSHGRNPVMTFEAYRAQKTKPVTDWKNALGEPSEAAIEAQERKARR